MPSSPPPSTPHRVFLSPKTIRKRPQSNEPSPRKLGLVKKRRDTTNYLDNQLPSRAEYWNSNEGGMGKSLEPGIFSSDNLVSSDSVFDDLNADNIKSKIPIFHNNFPSYNANTFSATLVDKPGTVANLKKKRKIKNLKEKPIPRLHSLLLNSSPGGDIIDSSEVADSSDVGYINTTDVPTSDLPDNDNEEEDSDVSIEDYIKQENSTFDASQMLSDPFNDKSALINRPILSEDLDEGIKLDNDGDFDKTPIFTSASSSSRRVSRTPFWTGPPNLVGIEKKERTEMPNFTLDAFGRVVTSLNENLFDRGNNLLNNSSSEDITEDDDNNDNEISKLILKKSPKNNIMRSKSLNNYQSNSINRLKARSFTRTSSSIEQTKLKIAKNIISSSIDESNSKIWLENLDLTNIPDEIEDLNNLVCAHPVTQKIYRPELDIYLNNNRIQELNPRLFNVKNLRALSLRGNQISKIPGKIRDISESLNYLQISGNKLIHLPAEILKLSKLDTLSISPNSQLIKFSEYCENHEVLSINYHTVTPSRFIRKHIGELTLTDKSVVKNYHNFYNQSLQSTDSKLPKLTHLCLRKFQDYDLSMQEIREWFSKLDSHYSTMVESTLKAVLEETKCYQCEKLLVAPAGETVEFYDICGIINVPILKQFCCLKCIEQYLSNEILTDHPDYSIDKYVDIPENNLEETKPIDELEHESNDLAGQRLIFNADF